MTTNQNGNDWLMYVCIFCCAASWICFVSMDGKIRALNDDRYEIKSCNDETYLLDRKFGKVCKKQDIRFTDDFVDSFWLEMPQTDKEKALDFRRAMIESAKTKANQADK